MYALKQLEGGTITRFSVGVPSEKRISRSAASGLLGRFVLQEFHHPDQLCLGQIPAAVLLVASQLQALRLGGTHAELIANPDRNLDLPSHGRRMRIAGVRLDRDIGDDSRGLGEQLPVTGQ